MNREELIRAMSEADASQLALLVQARENAKLAVLEKSTKQNLDAMEKAERMLREFRDKHGLDGEAQASSGLTFKTQKEALAYLKDQGFKVEKSKLSEDFKAGRLPRTPDGLFEASALLGYAKAHLKAKARAEDSAAATAAAQSDASKARLNDITAARQELRYKKELGLLMPRAEHEQDLASRALFFKAEIEGFIHRLGGEIIALAHGEESRLAALIEWWNEKTADWMDAWSADREFAASSEDETAMPQEETRP